MAVKTKLSKKTVAKKIPKARPVEKRGSYRTMLDTPDEELSQRNQAIKQQALDREAKGLPPLKSRRPRLRVGRHESGRAWSTQEKMEQFIASLKKCHNVGQACKDAGMSRHHAYQLKKDWPDFKALWVDAWEEGIDTLEAEAHKRAMSGSDILLMFMLNGNRSQKYKDRKAGDNGNQHMPSQFTINIKAAAEVEIEEKKVAALPEGGVYEVPPEDIRHLPPEEIEFQDD